MEENQNIEIEKETENKVNTTNAAPTTGQRITEEKDEDELYRDSTPTDAIRTKTMKFSFKLKQLDNGNIFTVHHTVMEQDRLIRIRMTVGCFNVRGSQFVAVDTRGNIFIFDMTIKKYWRLLVKVPKVSTIRQTLQRPNEYLFGTKLGHVLLVDIATASIVKAIAISTERIVQISFPGQPLQPSHLSLVHAGHEAILLDLDTFTATHRLDFDEVRNALKFACYVPHSEQIFTCFTNDSLHIWSGVTLNTLRIAQPIKARDRKIRLMTDPDSIATISLSSAHKQRSDNEFLLDCQDRDYSNGLIIAFSFTPDGGLLCISTLDSYLLLLSAYTYELQICLRLQDFVISKCVFLPKSKETLVLGVTTIGQVVLIDCQHSEFKLIVQTAHACNLSIGADGKLLAVLADTGEANIWSTCKLYNLLKSQENCMQLLRAAFKQPKPLAVGCDDTGLHEDIKKLLKHDRLTAILREFGCYPAKYRNLIWCSLLQLPCNKSEFQQLVKMGIPAAVKERAVNLKVKKEANKRLVIKIWSCLAHWCKVFAYSEFLPALIFPFVQVFPKNALVAFELCATLLLNHFQLWFEFHPLEPANYLGMCNNVLQCYDKELFHFYAAKKVLPQHYAWSLLSNAFSEVLDEEQWLSLWDNILSYPPYFPIFCAVAYSMQQREILLRLPNVDAIENFFHEQNPIDVCKLIAKAYCLMGKCPASAHPKRYTRDFVAIPKNVYPKFLKYPKQWVAQHEEELNALKQQHFAIDARIRELEMEELKMMERLESGLREEEHAKRMKEMEALYQNTLKREEERIACQRKMLLLYQKEIRSRKAEVLATLQESERRKKALQMENELDSLTHKIQRERVRHDSHLFLAEDELRNYELELITQKYFANTQAPTLRQKFRQDIKSLCKEKQLLSHNLERSPSLQQEPMLRQNNNLDEIENKLDEIQREFLSLTKLK